MPEHLAPGVYVEEAPSGACPISAVDASAAALFGRAPDATAPLRAPRFVTGFAALTRIFCAAGPQGGSTRANAVAGFFANGGSRLYIVGLGPQAAAVTPDDLLLLDDFEDISLVAAPDFANLASHEALIADCEGRRDRIAVLDTPEAIDPLERLTREESRGDDGPNAGLRPRRAERGLASIYTPWLVVSDALSGARTTQPLSGHVLGLYGRVAAARGVHKSPANLPIVDALGLVRAISSSEQALLNPEGVNCIRKFSNGIRIWGARTLAAPTSEWRYVAVRRLLTMIEQSVLRGTRWAMFEPNDARLWQALWRDVGAFLHALWRDDALAWTAPEQAYFTRCGA